MQVSSFDESGKVLQDLCQYTPPYLQVVTGPSISKESDSKSSSRSSSRKISRFLLILAILCLVPPLVYLFIPKNSPLSDLEAILGQPISEVEDDVLNSEQKRQELLRIISENQQPDKTIFAIYGSFVGAAVSILGFAFTAWKGMDDSERKEKEYGANNYFNSQQLMHSQKQLFYEILHRYLQNLDEDKQELKVNSLIGLVNLIETPLHKDVFNHLAANLLFEQPKGADRILVDGFTKALRQELAFAEKEEVYLDLTLSRSHLQHADLHGLDLSQATLKKKHYIEPGRIKIDYADLSHANLCGAILHRAFAEGVNLSCSTCIKANFNQADLQRAHFEGAMLHGAYFVSADLKGAYFNHAQLQGAKLQSAHLEKADLRGAKFESANVSDAYFYDADFDETSKVSLARAIDWSESRSMPHFNENIYEDLKRIYGNSHTNKSIR